MKNRAGRTGSQGSPAGESGCATNTVAKESAAVPAPTHTGAGASLPTGIGNTCCVQGGQAVSQCAPPQVSAVNLSVGATGPSPSQSWRDLRSGAFASNLTAGVWSILARMITSIRGVVSSHMAITVPDSAGAAPVSPACMWCRDEKQITYMHVGGKRETRECPYCNSKRTA